MSSPALTGSWFRGVAYTYVAARARAEGSPPGQTLFNLRNIAGKNWVRYRIDRVLWSKRTAAFVSIAQAFPFLHREKRIDIGPLPTLFGFCAPSFPFKEG